MNDQFENCKHGMNSEWCAYCLGKVDKPHVEGVGRGGLRIYEMNAFRAYNPRNQPTKEGFES